MEKLPTRKMTTLDFLKRKGNEKIVLATVYDFSFARLFDGQVDALLVGDSLGMMIQGNANTLSVTLEDVLYHTRAVTKGAHASHVIADMPFMTYQTGAEDALKNAGRLLAEGGAESVKLEGGVAIAETVSRLVQVGIPVMGHIGLTPQSVHAFGGFRVQGKTEDSAARIIQDARVLEEAGAYAVVLEGIPAPLAAQITTELRIPTIGIGAGAHCDGQVLVLHDFLGLNEEFHPKFTKRYAHLAPLVRDAVKSYAREVREGSFPGKEHSF